MKIVVVRPIILCDGAGIRHELMPGNYVTHSQKIELESVELELPTATLEECINDGSIKTEEDAGI